MLSLLGKLLRFDVDLPAPYYPADNPFVGDPTGHDRRLRLRTSASLGASPSIA